MFKWLLDSSLSNRLLVIIASLVLMAYGAFTLSRTPVDVAGAYLVVGGQKVPLIFVGASRVLREQALPLAFRAEGPALSQLAVGQPVAVVVQSRRQVGGVSVPAASLMKNPANQSIVWVKTAPERFEPRVVTVEPLDGATVVVTSGLAAGDRVATQGATLINQVR